MSSIEISHCLQRVKPSATLEVSARARQLREKGEDVIGLGAGEPDFPTPEPIIEAAIAAMRAGHTRYTDVDGIAELKQAICRKFARDNRLEYQPDQINVSPGGKAVLYNAFRASLNPGDEVVIPAPYWVSYPEMVRLCSAEPVIIAADRGYKITPERLDAAIGPATKWLILNSPSNPSGAAYSRTELQALAEVLLRHPHVMILTDDIYEHLVYDDFVFHNIAAIEPKLAERTLVMNGVSKAYAMTGWRIGYAGGPKTLIRAMAKVMSQTTSNPCSISQWAALAALDGDQSFLDQRRKAFCARRDMVTKALDTAPGLSCPRPEGAFYAYIDCSGLIGRQSAGGKRLDNDLDIATALLEEAKTAVVAGTAFGLSPAFRVSYAVADSVLEQACQRIRSFCEQVSQRT